MAPVPYDFAGSTTGSFTGFALCVVKNDNVLITGGFLNGVSTRGAYILNTVANKWVQLPQFRTARGNHASFSTNKAAFVCCGDYQGDINTSKTREIEELQFNQQLERNL